MKHALVLALLLCLLASRARAQSAGEGRYYGVNLQKYDTRAQALIEGTLMPADARSNIAGAARAKLSGASLLANAVLPPVIEIQRELASGPRLDFKKIRGTLDPAVIASAYVLGSAGDVAGAAIQSGLSALGPTGAVAGFIARPALGYLGAVTGMSIGKGISHGQTLKQSLAQAWRDFQPGRDIGQLAGGAIGGALGQVLIPVPVVGAIIGGYIGGVAGAAMGQLIWPGRKAAPPQQQPRRAHAVSLLGVNAAGPAGGAIP